MNLSDKKYLIFDFDETVDTLAMDWHNWSKNILRIIQKYDPSVQIPLKDIHFVTENIFIERFGESINQDFIKFQESFERKQLIGHQPNYVLVRFIQKSVGFTIFIWSNNHSQTVVPILKELGLFPHIKQYITRDMMAFAKPHLDGFKKLSIPEEKLAQTLFIGDSDTDSVAAQAASIDFIHVDDFVRLIKE